MLQRSLVDMSRSIWETSSLGSFEKKPSVWPSLCKVSCTSAAGTCRSQLQISSLFRLHGFNGISGEHLTKLHS